MSAQVPASRKRHGMNAQEAEEESRQTSAIGLPLNNIEKKLRELARPPSKRGAGDRAFWLALAANWEELAKVAEAPKIKPWSI
jgi:hypothetical protein